MSTMPATQREELTLPRVEELISAHLASDLGVNLDKIYLDDMIFDHDGLAIENANALQLAFFLSGDGGFEIPDTLLLSQCLNIVSKGRTYTARDLARDVFNYHTTREAVITALEKTMECCEDDDLITRSTDIHEVLGRNPIGFHGAGANFLDNLAHGLSLSQPDVKNISNRYEFGSITVNEAAAQLYLLKFGVQG